MIRPRMGKPTKPKAPKVNVPGGVVRRPGKKKRTKPRELEKPIHLAILEFLWVALYPGSLIHHSPNELGMSGEQAARLVAKAKEMGMKPGWPDIECVAEQPGEDGKFFVVEVKSETGGLSDEQKEVKAALIRMGVPYCLARSISDVESFLEWEGIKHRSVVQPKPLHRMPPE